MNKSREKLVKHFTGMRLTCLTAASTVMFSAYTYATWNYTHAMSTLNEALARCTILNSKNTVKCHSIDEICNPDTKIDETRKKREIKETNGIRPPSGEVRIILLGATGSGKSSTGNYLLNDKRFKTSCYAISKTKYSALRTLKRKESCNITKIDIIDTPAICKYDDNVDDAHDETEIKKAIALSSPGPHAFLLCIPATAVTSYYTDVLMQYEKYFGEKMYDFVIVAFTKYDHINNDQKAQPNIIKRFNGLQERLKCNDHIFLSNVSEENETEQLQNVIKSIEKIREKMKISKSDVYATCNISKRAEFKLIENIEKMRKLPHIANISRDAVKTNPGHLKQCIIEGPESS